MDVSVITSELYYLEMRLIADLKWENPFPGMDFWKGTFDLIII